MNSAGNMALAAGGVTVLGKWASDKDLSIKLIGGTFFAALGMNLLGGVRKDVANYVAAAMLITATLWTIGKLTSPSIPNGLFNQLMGRKVPTMEEEKEKNRKEYSEKSAWKGPGNNEPGRFLSV